MYRTKCSAQGCGVAKTSKNCLPIFSEVESQAARPSRGGGGTVQRGGWGNRRISIYFTSRPVINTFRVNAMHTILK